MRPARPLLGLVTWAALASTTGLGWQDGRARPPDTASPIEVRITSPIGRVGLPSRVRIVAQIRTAGGAVLQPVRFLVDGVPVGTDADGPPYGVDWTDENPFERHEIVVEAEDDLGRVGRDTILLQPFELTEATRVTSVLVEAAVYDGRGRFVSGLASSDFVLREDGAPQPLDLVRQEAIPATFALLVDSSQSMSRRIEFVRAAASRVLSYLREVDRVMVVPFSKTLGAITGPTQDQATVSDAIGSIAPVGGTAIFDAISEVAGRLAGMDGRRAIILLTDGYDEHSQTALSRALEESRRAQVTVYVVGIGGVAGISLKGERQLREIAAATGGRAFFPPREQDLVDVYDVLAADAQNRYLITYTPNNQRADGRWRSISVSTSDESHRVRARDGYYAPNPPRIRPSIEFTVMDLQSRYVDISRDDLEVLEDGVPQTIETFQEAVNPVSLVLALDASGSMRRSIDAVIEAARRFVLSLRPEDRLSILVFADEAVIEHGFATDRSWSIEAIDRYRAAGGTALYDALYGALEQTRAVQGRRAIVVLTDGRDENNPGTAPGSLRTYREVRERLRDTEVTVFTVGLGTKIDADLLREMARFSGGQAYFPSDVSTLSEEYGKVVENLRRRFVVSYTSTNLARDGQWRTVEIRTRTAGIRVASREGYYAPER